MVHFGLGEHQRIDRLTIQWPSGQTQAFEKLVSGRLYTITEPDIPALPGPASKRKEPLFAASSAFRWVDHVENDYDDYARQPLLPGKLSQFGPGVAVGDVDRDGREDVYIGGAAGQPGMLYLNEGGGHFSWGPLEPFMEDRGYEDMAPLFFDADLDGDADLYVVSGGVECEAGDAILRDRLYLNDGKGHFHPSSRRRPAQSARQRQYRDSGWTSIGMAILTYLSGVAPYLESTLLCRRVGCCETIKGGSSMFRIRCLACSRQG